MRVGAFVAIVVVFTLGAPLGWAEEAGTASQGAQGPVPIQQAAPPAAAPLAAPPIAPPAADIDLDAVLEPVKRAVGAIEALEKQVDYVRTSDPDLSQRRSEVDALMAETAKAADALQPHIDAARVLLEKLGQPPKDKEPGEAPQVAKERTRLSAILSSLEGAFKSSELVKARGRQLGTRIQELRHGLFAAHLFERSESPLLPGIWRQLGDDLGSARIQLFSVFGTWQTIIAERWRMALSIAATALLVFAIIWFATRRVINSLMPAGAVAPGYMKRASAACLAAPLFALPAIAAAVIAYFGFHAFGLVYSHVEEWSQDLLQGVLILIVVAALATAILEPRRPAWRLVDLSNKTARSLWRTVGGFALVYAADLIAKQTIRLLVLPLPFTVALSFVTSFAFAALLLRASATRFVPARLSAASSDASGQAMPVPLLAPIWLKIPLLVVATAIMGASITGYVALGRLAAGQVVITGSAIVLALLLHLGIKTAERAVESQQTGIGGWLAGALGYDQGQRRIIGSALSVILHALLGLGLIPGLLLAWGFSIDDVMSGLKSAMFGFEIGHFRISFARILMAIGLFAAIVFATRIVQRWLQGSVLRPDRMDPGIANSIHQGLGYAGFALGALAAISFAGIDITNFAIVAGALSVGIGFGLQSIVNNFVSGLILLVERPIKVGDWIVVKGGGEGYVRAISVRSTEIETFDRASLIVPNSELISNVVTNWTHRNALGRVIVKVNASYKSDPDQVLRVLSEVAAASPLVMQQPPPLVTFDNLGPDALEFSIRVLVADISRALSVQTQLRSAVMHAFRKQGIDFPTPERDIYLRDLDGLKVLIARIAQERARQQATQGTGVEGKPQT